MKINIKGPIISNGDKWIYDLFEEDATCPRDVLSTLPENGEEVEVTVNSFGGLVDQGNEIYTALKDYKGKVAINIVTAGSAASIIAMAGNPTRISPVGQIMIHNVAMGAGGDYHDMEKASEILQKANQSLAKAYELKTGLAQSEILEKMDAETWLTADEAKELGFVDEIMFENEERPSLVADVGSGMIPPKIIHKVKELVNKKQEQSAMTEEKVNELITKKLNKQNEESQPEEKSPFARFFF